MEELKDFVEKADKKFEEFKAAVQEKDAQIDELSKQATDFLGEQEKLREMIVAQDLTIKDLREANEKKQRSKKVTFMDVMTDELEKNWDSVQAIKEKVNFQIKRNFNTASKYTESSADITSASDFAQMLPGIGRIPTRRWWMKDFFRIEAATTEIIKAANESNIVRDAKTVDGCAPTTSDSQVQWTVEEFRISKVRDFINVCIDMLVDFEFVTGEIRRLIYDNVQLKVDEQLLLGDGVYPNLNGVDFYAQDFDVTGTCYENSVQSAQIIDLIGIAGCMVRDAGENNFFFPDTVLMNPCDACLLRHVKTDDGYYLYPMWPMEGEQRVGQMRIYDNPLVPEGQMYVFDSTRGVIYERREASIEFAYENRSNFEQELVTMKAYERLQFVVREVDRGAFLHVPDIAAAIQAITAP